MSTWALVLAAGQGSRLAGLTRVGSESIPKQFCSLRGDGSMLRSALERAERTVPCERIVTVVAGEHRRWWESELAHLPPRHVVVQPDDRGTAAGLLLPLLRIVDEDANATVVVLPSDHHIEDEWTLQTGLFAALGAVRRRPGRAVLLGLRPDHRDPDLGWIVPKRRAVALEATAVARFREKPPAEELTELLAAGAVANVFVLAATAATLLGLYEQSAPDLLASMRTAGAGAADEVALGRLYQELPRRDFSRHVLEPAAGRLAVLTVPPCGWSDLGTPDRVARCLASPAARPARQRAVGHTLPSRAFPVLLTPLDLSRALGGATGHLQRHA